MSHVALACHLYLAATDALLVVQGITCTKGVYIRCTGHHSMLSHGHLANVTVWLSSFA